MNYWIVPKVFFAIWKKQIESVSRLSTVPYENKGSFFFIESVKKNQIETVEMLLATNKCFVSDFIATLNKP